MAAFQIRLREAGARDDSVLWKALYEAAHARESNETLKDVQAHPIMSLYVVCLCLWYTVNVSGLHGWLQLLY